MDNRFQGVPDNIYIYIYMEIQIYPVDMDKILKEYTILYIYQQVTIVVGNASSQSEDHTCFNAYLRFPGLAVITLP